MASCPKCGRPTAIAGTRCLYCGASLPEAGPEKLPEKDPGESGTWLVVVDVQGATPELLSRELSLPAFDAEQRRRRGGLHLVQAAEEAQAHREGARLREAGLTTFMVPEREVREAARPFPVLRGAVRGTALHLHGPEGALEVGTGEPILLVRGDITRSRQTSEAWRRAGGPLHPGLRIHLHRRSSLRPAEIDPLDFECGEAPIAGSALLEINRWLAELFAGLPEDAGFRHEHPALAPAATPESGVASLVRTLKSPPPRAPKDEAVILDNLGQFRFYSAWRGAVERRRQGG